MLADAADRYHSISPVDAYPAGADEETRSFIRFWFDSTNRRQLAALSEVISSVRDPTGRTFLWCALSRLIITKQAGASLAMDVSHSRPHKTYTAAPVKPLDRFLFAIEAVLRASPFAGAGGLPRATIRKADARDLPLDDESIDLVVTSPPYLNAIDYLRGHRLSLVWMGYKVEEIRRLRSSNVGTERSLHPSVHDEYVFHALREMGRTEELEGRFAGMLARYVRDMDGVLGQIARVLKQDGEAVLVVGDSTIRGVFVRNSRALAYLGKRNGLQLRSARRRPLLENRRYLPPPGRRVSGRRLGARMREEVVLAFCKA
jgi:hypothetical protein